MCLQHWLVLATLIFVGTARGSSDIAKLEAQLEVQRVAIESDRKSLNADCGPTVSKDEAKTQECKTCLLYTSPSPRDGLLSRMPSSA